jgi:molybdate transport system ATP-binding protein
MDPRPETPTLKIERLQPTITDLSAKPPHKRSLAYAPQDAALFPHLTVRENIRFPFQVHAEPLLGFTLVEDAIDLFHLHTLAERLPHSLSGGEAQRVALARAFATPSACLLLLDEPFAGLDLALRDELLPAMQHWTRDHNIPVLSVTHDVDEALLLHADVIRLDHGRVLAQGPAAEVLAPDRDRLLAALR